MLRKLSKDEKQKGNLQEFLPLVEQLYQIASHATQGTNQPIEGEEES